MDAVTTAANLATSADDALVRRARRGDAAAFAVLVDTRIDRCYRLAWSILSNDADAADATQDALVSAWRQLPRLRDPATFDGWLNRIVANAALMARRHRVRLREVSVRPAHPGDETPQPEPRAGPPCPNGDGRVRRQRRDRARLRPPATEGPDDPRPPPRRGTAGRRDRAVTRDPGRNRQVASARCPQRAREGDGGRGMNGRRLTDGQISQALRAHLPGSRPGRSARTDPRIGRDHRRSSGRCPRSSGLVSDADPVTRRAEPAPRRSPSGCAGARECRGGRGVAPAPSRRASPN